MPLPIHAVELTCTFLQDLHCLPDLQGQPIPRLSPPVVHGCKKEVSHMKTKLLWVLTVKCDRDKNETMRSMEQIPIF
jgi:hypothetical protein